MLCQNPHWWSPIILTMKLTYLFWFCTAGSSLQSMTTDSQTLCHNFAFRFLSLFLFKVFFFNTKMVFCQFLILTFLCLQRQTQPYDKTHKVCAPYCRQPATVQLPVRADRLKHVHSIVTGNSSIALRMGLGVTWALILYTCSYPSYWRLLLHTQPEDAPRHGERSPLIMACALYYLIFYGTDIYTFP